MPLSKFPRFPLAHLPTPLEPLDRLPRHLGGPRLYIKRDDCTGLALGGNKTRKAEFLIGAARAAGATAVIAEGGLQSNHVRQIAAAAAKAGLTCHLVLNRNVPIETAIYRENGNLLLDRVLGAVVRCVRTRPDACRCHRAPVAGVEKRRRSPLLHPDRRFERDRRARLRGGGAGAAAAGQAGRHGDHRVLFASSSGGTQAGLVVGMALADASTQVLGIDIENEADALLAEVRKIADACAHQVGLKRALRDDAFAIRSGYGGEGYGIPTPGMIEAVGLLARLEGIRARSGV